MEKNKIRIIKIWTIILILLFLVIPLTYAIYKNFAKSNKELALARWNVTLNQSGENNYLSIIPDPNGTNASYTINITSQSELDIIYSIVIENLPSGVSISLDGGTFEEETNNKVILSNVGTIAYNDNNKTKSHIITFKASNNATFVNEQEVDINVIARQAL